MNEQPGRAGLSDPDIVRLVAESIEKYGVNHTHDFECRTWRGMNWAGACDCTLRERSPSLYDVILGAIRPYEGDIVDNPEAIADDVLTSLRGARWWEAAR